MNRDIVSVLLGGFGTKATGGGEAMAIEGEATMTSSSDVALALTEANSVSARYFCCFCCCCCWWWWRRCCCCCCWSCWWLWWWWWCWLCWCCSLMLLLLVPVLVLLVLLVPWLFSREMVTSSFVRCLGVAMEADGTLL